MATMNGRLTARWVRAAGRALTALMIVSRPAIAHPIHTTLTVISADPAAHVLTLKIRAFVDDFSASVARFAGHTPPADSSVLADEVVRYVRAHFAVIGPAGEAVALESCGVTRAREVYWLCFRVRLPAGVRGTMVQNQMLTELHADQVNIVQLENGAVRRSFLFTRGSDPSALP